MPPCKYFYVEMNDSIGERIKSIMLKESLNYNSMGNKMGISAVVLRNTILDKNKPSYELIMHVLSVFKWVNPGWLLTGEGLAERGAVQPAPVVSVPSPQGADTNKLQGQLELLRSQLSAKEKLLQQRTLELGALKARVLQLEQQLRKPEQARGERLANVG